MNTTSRPISRIGIVSGVRQELQAFLPDEPREQIAEGSLAIEHLQWQGKDLFATCAGVGKVAAAVAATVLCTRFAVELILIIGTAGKVGPIEGELFCIGEAIQSDFGAKRTGGMVHYSAGTLPIGSPAIEPFQSWAGARLDLPNTRIATSDLFIQCGVHADYVHEALGAPLVDMETAAVAQAASLLGVPWMAIKATTDDAGDSSDASFTRNLAAAARASACAAERLMALL
jgi:nucleoside phosphorylase